MEIITNNMETLVTGYLYEKEYISRVGNIIKKIKTKEIGLPLHQLSFNCHNGKVNISSFNSNEMPSFKCIDLPNKIVTMVLQIYQLQTAINCLTMDILRSEEYIQLNMELQNNASNFRDFFKSKSKI